MEGDSTDRQHQGLRVGLIDALLYLLGLLGLVLGIQNVLGTGDLLSMASLLYFGAALSAVAIAVVGLRLQTRARLRLVLALAGIGTALICAEWSLRLWSEYVANPQRVIAERRGNEYDERRKREVVRDLRQQGVEAVPTVSPATHLDSEGNPTISLAGSAPVLPLSGIGDRLTVFCNESGSYAVYRSDRYGYNNPAGVWNEADATVAVLGDSFVHGACVDPGQNLVARIRTRWSQTLNLGYAGTGPLMQLAILHEFLPAVEPEVVVWGYYEGNDLWNLESEARSALLRSYLTRDRVQDLAAVHSKIDSILDSIVERRLRRTQRGPTSIISDLGLTLFRLRDYVGLTRSDLAGNSVAWRDTTGYRTSRANIPLFGRVLERARATVSSWGGKLLFLYLPSWDRFYGSMRRGDGGTRRQLLETVRRLGIPVIDVASAFRSSDSVPRLFGQGELSYSHYSSKGYAVAGRKLSEKIRDVIEGR